MGLGLHVDPRRMQSYWYRSMKNSLTDPLRIAVVSPPDIQGTIGLTLCPGKKDPVGGWDRDLEIDVAVISDRGADVVGFDQLSCFALNSR